MQKDNKYGSKVDLPKLASTNYCHWNGLINIVESQ
jgi:hypothetical protein